MASGGGGGSSGADQGFCKKILDEEGVPTPRGIVADATNCTKFVFMGGGRIRTNAYEFMGGDLLRVHRDFQEK